MGADFIAKFLKGTKVYLSNPTWGNHKNIFTDAGVEWEWYRYSLPYISHLDILDAAFQVLLNTISLPGVLPDVC